MTPSTKGQEKPIPDLGASFNDLEDGGMAILVWHKDQYREVLEIFSFFEEQLQASKPTTEQGMELRDKFYRVEELLHNRVRRVHAASDH